MSISTGPNSADAVAPPPELRGDVGRFSPSILRVTGPGPFGAETVDTAVALGFDTLLLPALDVPTVLSEAAWRSGVSLFADVTLDRAPAQSVDDSSPFTLLSAPLLDPRDAPQAADHAPAAIASEADADALAQWWGSRIEAMRKHGLAGVRLLGLAGLPGWALPRVFAGLRRAAPDMILFGWTPGVSWEALEALQPGALDLVASSLPWWDGRADWIWRELDLLRRIAPVVADAGDAQNLGALAACFSEGWMATGSVPDAASLNRTRVAFAGLPWSRLVAPAGSAVVAILRTDVADPREASRAALAITAQRLGEIAVSSILAAVTAPLAASGALDLGARLSPQPGTLVVYSAEVLPVVAPAGLQPGAAEHAASLPRVAIEAPSPCVENGRFPSRRVVGTEVVVEGDVITDGHDQSAAMLRWRSPGSDVWHETPMQPVGNDRWRGSFPLQHLGVHHYAIEAWRDAYATFVDEVEKKHRAGVPITLELQEGAALVSDAAGRAASPVREALEEVLRAAKGTDIESRRILLLSHETRAAMAQADDRPLRVTIDPIPVHAERLGAAFASWYEVFPRSMSDDPARHGTFRDVVRQLPRIQAMGFDVLYFPPIHPIGRINRKGRNNTLTPAADDPGSPYAIGSEDGGHDALHPELGTIEDFQDLREAAARHGIELAIDFAIQCSPDHPWLKQHKEWFNWRPDGSIRYAENPPKKYEDIVNVDFYGKGAVPGLWVALAEAVLYWASQGVRLFRVDNPHTKPLPFWEWMIAEVQARYPDTAFLAEAFTRPKVMYRLAKAGFGQSYTYFTWRNSKQELTDYVTELADGPPRDFFRPHFFVNTPDINPTPLQTAPRSGFLTRAALAATLSGLWGVYSGFELCEATPIPGREEYMDSEKYQIRAWDWDRPGNIVREIAQLNSIRRLNPALHTHLGVTFLRADDPNVMLFEKATPDRSNVLLIAINMDLYAPHGSRIEVPFWKWPTEPAALDTIDLLTDRRERWTGRDRFVQLTAEHPYAIWRIAPVEALT